MKAIRHIGIVVSDLQPVLHFYRDLLGLKVVKKRNEYGKYIDKISSLKNVKVTTIKLCTENGSLVELLYYHTPPKKVIAKKEIYKIGFSHIAFTVENLDTEYKRLLKAGVQFNSTPQISPDGYAKVTFCRDPEGNFIELVEVLKK